MKVTASLGYDKYLVEATETEIAHLIHGDGFHALPDRMKDTPAGGTRQSGLKIGLTFDPVPAIRHQNRLQQERGKLEKIASDLRAAAVLVTSIPARIIEAQSETEEGAPE